MFFLYVALLVGHASAYAYGSSSFRPDTIPVLWPYHAALMIAAFLLLATGVVMAVRKRVGWLDKHKVLVIGGVFFAIFGFLIAVYMVSIASTDHFRYPHAYLGGVVIFMLLINIFLGFFQVKIMSKMPKIRVLHRLEGRTALLLMVLNMTFGFWIALQQ